MILLELKGTRNNNQWRAFKYHPQITAFQGASLRRKVTIFVYMIGSNGMNIKQQNIRNNYLIAVCTDLSWKEVEAEL